MTKELSPGKMYRPTAIIRDINVEVYVVEQFNHRVSKWVATPTDTPPANFDFTLVTGWGSNSDGTSGVPGTPTAVDDDKLNFPTGIAVDNANNRLFVSDTLNHRVRVLNLANGNFTGSISSAGTGDTNLYRPTHMDYSPGTNKLAIADSFNHRVVVYNSGGGFQGIATPPAEGFHTPHGVKHNANQAKFFYSDLIRGKLYSYLSSDGLTPTTPTTIGTPGTESTDPNQLFYPGSASGSTDTVGNSWLSDTRNNKIKEFTPAGNISDVFTTAGTGDGEFYHPEDTTGFVDTGSDYLLIANTLNNRIEVYDRATNIFQTTFGSP
jgi:hypothetical protein